tara:strand:+ start:294 stop:2645 length:2352 start_codon:yes stop_codon:yes gene_type:complete
MKKSLIFFLFLIVPSALFSQEINNKVNNCNFILHELNSEKANYPKIEQIDVKINKSKNWTVNSLRIATGNFRFIPSKYKKRFNSTLLVNFKNNLNCKYKAAVRFSGDQKDHIDLNLKENFINQSIDVSLKDGHINGIVKFKLLLKRTRGKDEILITEIFRELGYLSPRTSLVNVKINNVHSEMIFQEKSRKELLENNFRREGPLLEGDERLTWLLSQKVPLDHRSNREAGLLNLAKTGFKSILAKQLNSRLILRNDNLKLMSYNSLSNLNLVYLKYTNDFEKDTRYLESYRYYTLENELLGFTKKNNVIFLDIYNLLVMASSDGHSLAPNNRQFYWNAVKNFFEPISYDGNFDVFKSSNLLIKPTSIYFLESWNNLNLALNNIDIEKLNKTVNQKGILESVNETQKKIEKLKNNLKEIKIKYLNERNVKKVSTVSKEEIDIESYNWEELVNNIKKIKKEALFVKQDDNNSFSVCENLNNCKKVELSDIEIAELLDGDLTVNKHIYQFLGKNINKKELIDDFKYNIFKFQNSRLYFSDGITFNFNSDNDNLNIYQNKPSGRAFFLGGSIENVQINFFGYKNDNFNPKNNFISNNINGLTGCLSFINLAVKNISLKAKDSICEDGVNLINTSGTFENIDIINSFSDAFDADFSKVIIYNLNIYNAKNDCADFSYGEYRLIASNFYNCGDKSLSVGEKSNLTVDTINIKNSNIGIASKDSSIVSFSNGDFMKVNYCLAAYNKKQEFFGGLIKFKKLECVDYKNYYEIDTSSKIIKNGKDLKSGIKG